MVSIIIPVYNQLHLTRNCINLIQQHTEGEYEIIVVNNGSTDRTKKVLDRIRNIRVIHNQYNEGFAKACNKGITRARGDLLLLLNNDTLVGPKWLSNMKKCILSDPIIGMVGPRSNFVGGLQLIRGPRLEHQLEFTRRFNQHNPEKWFDLDFLSGFCLLIKREVINQIGLLDERFGIGSYEDNDYCTRARRAGFRLVCAGDTFVYHLGSQTFKGNRLNDVKIGAENHKKYIDKWGSI
ncbi:glycosyltransferase family 2 protein [Alkaliphilus crotonatoxidans]